MMNDEITLGFDIIDQAAKQGAKTFVHISFERHLGITTIAQRQANFKTRCAELGLDVIDLNGFCRDWDSTYYRDYCHFTEEGFALLAEEMTRRIRAYL